MMEEAERNPRQIFSELGQIGVVVRDVKKSAQFLLEVFGIGPFRVIDYPPETRDDIERYYRGKPADFKARLAFASLGSVELELIQPLAGDNIWYDFLAQHGEGLHHIRFNVRDTEQATDYLAQQGVGIMQQGSGLRPGTVFTYFDTESEAGFIIETLNRIPGTDGRSPVSEDGTVKL